MLKLFLVVLFCFLPFCKAQLDMDTILEGWGLYVLIGVGVVIVVCILLCIVGCVILCIYVAKLNEDKKLVITFDDVAVEMRETSTKISKDKMLNNEVTLKTRVDKISECIKKDDKDEVIVDHCYRALNFLYVYLMEKEFEPHVPYDKLLQGLESELFKMLHSDTKLLIIKLLGRLVDILVLKTKVSDKDLIKKPGVFLDIIDDALNEMDLDEGKYECYMMMESLKMIGIEVLPVKKKERMIVLEQKVNINRTLIELEKLFGKRQKMQFFNDFMEMRIKAYFLVQDMFDVKLKELKEEAMEKFKKSPLFLYAFFLLLCDIYEFNPNLSPQNKMPIFESFQEILPLLKKNEGVLSSACNRMLRMRELVRKRSDDVDNLIKSMV